MRTTDIIRNVLDLIDQIEQNDHGIEMEVSGEESDSRFKQIVAMLSNKQSSYTTEPNEVVAPIEAVTTDAGGGVNGPKHPADIRVKDPGYGHGS
jgi:hypothetical protein